MDVRLDPLESEELVKQSGIGHAPPDHLFRRQEAERTESVLHRHDYEAVLVGLQELGEVVLATARAIATTMNPDQDGQVACVGGALHVEKQAIL
jgi:hypothetical protein